MFGVIMLGLACLAFIVAAAGAVAWLKFDRSPGSAFIGGGIFLILVIVVAAVSFTSIPAQSVGVQISFGKPVHNFGPGIHPKAPWTSVVEMDGRTQTEDHTGDKRTEIRLGNQATGYVQNSLRWKIRPEAAGNLYADYRDFEAIGPKLVDLELAAALNAAFADFDPSKQLRAAEGDPGVKKVSNEDLAQLTQQRLVERIGNRITIEQVVITKIDYDNATQDRLNQLQQEIGNTRIAVQHKLTAEAEAVANEKLAASLAKNPNVLTSRCMDVLAKMVDRGMAPNINSLPCWPGSAQQALTVATK